MFLLKVPFRCFTCAIYQTSVNCVYLAQPLESASYSSVFKLVTSYSAAYGGLQLSFRFWGKHYSTWSTKNHFLFCLSGCVPASVCVPVCVCVLCMFASACLLLLSSHNLPWLWAALDLWQKRRLNATAALRCHTDGTNTHSIHSQQTHTRSTHTSRTRSSSVSALSPWFFVFVKKCIKPPAINCYSLGVPGCVCVSVCLLAAFG